MALRAFSEFYDHILPYLPAVETPLVDYHIRRVVREFCRRTTIWRQVVNFTTEIGEDEYLFRPYTVLPVDAGLSEQYALTEDDIWEPISILSVTVDGRTIPPVPEEYRRVPGQTLQSQRPTGWFSPSPRVIVFNHAPTEELAVALHIVAGLSLEPGVVEVPEMLVADYREVISDGVVSSLKMLAQKPWYDPEGAQIAGRRFVGAVLALRGKLRDAGQPSVSTARAPRFGA